MKRNGCARSHVGNVLVEKRWCTSASAETIARRAGRGRTRRPGARAACPCRRSCASRTTARRTPCRACSDERPDRVARALADDVELALEGVLVDVARAARRRTPAGSRARLPSCAPTGPRCRVGTSRQPSSAWPSSCDGALDLVLARHARGRLLRQEHHADAVLADRGQRDAELAAGARKNASGIWIRMPAPSPCSGSAPVAPRCVRLLRICRPCATIAWLLRPLMCATKPEAARVVLVRRVVQALRGRRPGAGLPLKIVFGTVVHRRAPVHDDRVRAAPRRAAAPMTSPFRRSAGAKLAFAILRAKPFHPTRDAAMRQEMAPDGPCNNGRRAVAGQPPENLATPVLTL